MTEPTPKPDPESRWPATANVASNLLKKPLKLAALKNIKDGGKRP